MSAVQGTMSEGEKDRAAFKQADDLASRLAPGMKSTRRPFSGGGKTPVKTHFRSGRKVRAHTRRS